MRYLIVIFYLSVASTFAKSLPSSNEAKIDADLNLRIIGGQISADGEFPHMVSIGIVSWPIGNHKCGGVIVHEEWVITAAHCVHLRGNASDYEVAAGSNELDGRDRHVYRVLEIHSHELFNEDLLHDIAILKVEKMEFSKKINKIKLEKAFVGGDVSVTLSGWGSISEQTVPWWKLRDVTYNTSTVEECRKRVPDLPIENTQICTLHRPGIGVGCVGEAGSSLMRTVDGVRYVVGIVSYIPSCGSGYYPDIFSRVSSYVSWLNQKCNCNL